MTSPHSKVLVVEDDPAMLRFIRRTLEIDGHTVETATDGPAALEAFRRQRPNLVVLDIGLPYIDGLEVCRQMQDIHPAPVIMVTARGEDQDIVRGFDVGAEDYLAKPFAGGVLSARVNALLRRSQHWPGVSVEKFECGALSWIKSPAESLVMDKRCISRRRNTGFSPCWRGTMGRS